MTESTKKRKLLGCITELDIGGAENAFVRILTGLKERGWDVHSVSLRDSGPMAEKLRAAGVPVTTLSCRGLADIRAFWRLRRVVRTVQPTAVLSFLHQANFYSRLASVSSGAAVVSGIRVADGRRAVIWPDRLTKNLVRQYVGVSSSVMEKHQSWCRISSDICSSIPNGVDVPVATATVPRDKNRILFVGRLTAQKSPGLLLTAVSQLIRDGDQVHVQIVGDGPLRSELKGQARDLGMADSVEFLGQRSDVEDLMQRSTVLVLPSQWEGMPNVVLEAMANQLPVIATDVDGISDVVTNETDGVLVPSGNAKALAKAIQRVLSDQTFQSRLAENALQKVQADYCWSGVIDRYDRLLTELTSDSRK